MKEVKIVSDSTFDLPVSLIENYNIGVIPANIIFENEIRQQYVNITNEEFYLRLIEEKETPTTGVPAPKIFKAVYEKALEEADEMIVFTASSKLSGLHSTATMVVKQFFDEKRIAVVDTLCTTLQMGLIVLEAARKAKARGTKQEILEYVYDFLIPNTQLLGAAATLKYLERGGRVGRVTSLVGELLSIKPLIHFEDGEIVSPGKARGMDTIYDLMKNVAQKIAGQQQLETAFVIHTANLAKAEELAEYFRAIPNAPEEILVAEVGPVVGSHVGPGGIGLVWMGNYDEKFFKNLKISLHSF